MKKLDLTAVTDVASFPLKSTTMNFLQEAHQETATAIVTSLLGFTPDPFKGYIISGGKVTIAGSNYTFTEGYIYFNNELFKLNASAFVLGGGQQVVANITNVPYTSADPVLFGDGILRTVHLNRQLTFSSANSGDLLYTNVIRTAAWLTGDIKEIDCTNAYITANFDGSGLGINERAGWAICNGQNGTKNRNGRVSLAFGTSYPTMGATGGAATHTLTIDEMPAHTHDYQLHESEFRADFDSDERTPKPGYDIKTTESTGGGLPHNNLQPYIVTLFIQKI